MNLSRCLPLALLLAASACSHRAPAPADAAPAAEPTTVEAIRWPEVAIDWTRPVPTEPIAQPGYSGSAACEGCHQSIYKMYARHAMARTGLRKLDAARVRQLAPALVKPEAAHHDGSGFSYRAFRKGDQLFVEEFIDGPDGKRIHSSVQQITHTFTSGVFGLSFGFQRGSYIYAAPIDWYPGSKTWALDPAFVVNGRFGMTVGALCIACHSEYPRHKAGSEHAVVEPLPEGVGCERCHGPGAKHVETGDKKDIVNPAKLPPRRQLDVCGQCHLEGVAAVLRAGRSLYSFRPGEPLWAYRINYVDAQARPGEPQVSGHSERLVRSACFQRSPSMTCTTCHNPHKSSLEETADSWRTACLKCHEKEHPCTGPAAARTAAGDRCAGCHMRKDTPPGFRDRVAGVSLPISDHWIRRRIDDPVPAHLSKIDRIVSYAELTGEHPEGPDLPAVEAVALRVAGLVDQAVPSFIKGVHARPRMNDLYENLGNYYKGLLAQARDPADRLQRADSYRLARATPLSFEPDDVNGLMGYARAILTIGTGVDLGEAARALDRVLRLVPDHAGALEEKGGYLFRAGKLAEAKPLLERAAASGPQQLQSQVLLGVIERDAGQLPAAALRFEAARRIEPRDRWILRQLRDLYGRTHDRAHLADVEHALAQLDLGAVPDLPSAATRWLSPAQR